MTETLSVALASHVHLARCGEDIVVLDVRTDAYALLCDAAAIIDLDETNGAVRVSPDVRDDLRSLGLTTETVSPAARRPLPGLTGETPAYTGHISGADRLGAGLDSLASSIDFARRPFHALIRRAAARYATGPTPPDARIARAVAAFQAVHPWIAFEGDCLQRGYRLHHHLNRIGIPARWVFGVRTWPFLAHCWVQVGDRVAGDTLDRVSGFTPILAV